jgi:hypothetical protein
MKFRPTGTRAIRYVLYFGSAVVFGLAIAGIASIIFIILVLGPFEWWGHNH